MYDHRRTRIPIRDPAASYGAAAPDRFPADEVLRDLVLAEGADAAGRAARILARYAALRHWLLRQAGAPTALTRHARSAARAHLAHLRRLGGPNGTRWAEGLLLRRLLDADLVDGASLLAAAAGEAAAGGDREGAAALAASARAATRGLGDGGGPDLN